MATTTVSARGVCIAGTDNKDKEEVDSERKKYLTAKYGVHQMRLIRKRISIESWVDDQLRELYGLAPEDNQYPDLDLDEVLNYNTDEERRQFVQTQILQARKSQEEVNIFLDELMVKLNEL